MPVSIWIRNARVLLLYWILYLSCILRCKIHMVLPPFLVSLSRYTSSYTKLVFENWFFFPFGFLCFFFLFCNSPTPYQLLPLELPKGLLAVTWIFHLVICFKLHSSTLQGGQGCRHVEVVGLLRVVVALGGKSALLSHINTQVVYIYEIKKIWVTNIYI